MARIRTIKPEAFDDETLSELSFAHRWIFAGLWTQADKAGRMEDRPKRLKARIAPFDDIDMDAILTDLARAEFIVRYQVDGKPYLAIKASSWEKHQRPRPDEPDSVLPSYSDDGVTVEVLDSTESVSAECLGKERKGRERKGESAEPDGSTPPASIQEASELRVRAEDGEVILTFPVVGTKGAEWRLRRKQLEEWQGLFPGLDVMAECRHALAWVLTNPGRRKTAKGMPRFLTAWLTRSVDRRGVGGGPREVRRVAEQEPARRDWTAECQEMHGGTCHGQYAHHTRKTIDAGKHEVA